jgi:alpha-tubulin suppressor-like RCC1 family protein
LLDDGKVFRWGKDYKEKVPKEIKILSKKNIVQISGGFEIFCALGQNGSVYIYDYQSHMRVSEVEDLSNVRISRIISGGNYVFAISAERGVYSWVRLL